jgi:hypothetical protein
MMASRKRKAMGGREFTEVGAGMQSSQGEWTFRSWKSDPYSTQNQTRRTLQVHVLLLPVLSMG